MEEIKKFNTQTSNMYNSKEINLYNLTFEEIKENNYLSSCSCLLLLLENHWFRISLEEWNTTFCKYLQEALWIVPRMSSPLKTPKLDSWGHPPTHALTCLLHPIALTSPPTPPHAHVPHVFTIEVISRHVFMQMLFLHYFWDSCFALYFSVVWTASWSTFWF